MSAPKHDDATIVIRTTEERTLNLCKAIILKQVSSENVHIVRKSPFYAALQETLEIGISAAKKWMIAVDADVLLYDDAIPRMVAKAETFDESFFFYQGRILDKLFLGYRSAGPHLYNVPHLEKALSLKAGFEQDDRPESFIRSKMEANGHPFMKDAEVYGIHDFEQSFADIYRKSFSIPQKHKKLAKGLMDEYDKLGTQDPDFRLAAEGIKDAVKEIDNETKRAGLQTQANEVLERLDLDEKDEFEIQSQEIKGVVPKLIQQFMNTHDLEASYFERPEYFKGDQSLLSKSKSAILKFFNQ